MPMSNRLFAPILAMDSCNKFYPANLAIKENYTIGKALIRQNVNIEQASWEASEFFSLAYYWNGQNIIRYRGKNPEFDTISVSDFLNSPIIKDAWAQVPAVAVERAVHDLSLDYPDRENLLFALEKRPTG